MDEPRRKSGRALWAATALVIILALMLWGLPYWLWAVGMQISILFEYRPAEFALLVAVTWAIVFAVRWAIKR
jgi:hypothetical protein